MSAQERLSVLSQHIAGKGFSQDLPLSADADISVVQMGRQNTSAPAQPAAPKEYAVTLPEKLSPDGEWSVRR